MEERKKPSQVELIHKKYDFRWEVLEVMVGGRSLIDTDLGLSGFLMHSQDDADRFMKSYGYDFNDPIEKAEVLGNFHEALNFIGQYFLGEDTLAKVKLEIPRKISEISDIRDLLLMASHRFPGQMDDREGNELRQWACSVLKVVHTIAHIDRDPRASYFSDIQKQILDRFYRYIHRTADGKLYLGVNEKDPLRVNLEVFETKSKKARDSLLLKLLHKAESVSDDIFDQVGLRLITSTRLEAIRAVKYLKDTMLVVAANIKPSRSRNTLINVDDFRGRLEELLARVDRGEMDEPSLVRELDSAVSLPLVSKNDNPHSSEKYQSIQFTCRQLIKIENPLYDQIKRIKEKAKAENLSKTMSELVDRIDLQYIQKEVRFFYPYEVQIMDIKANRENEQGESAHSEYKKAQIRTAMRRVLGSLLIPNTSKQIPHVS